jgi:hypothetical protein
LEFWLWFLLISTLCIGHEYIYIYKKKSQKIILKALKNGSRARYMLVSEETRATGEIICYKSSKM